MVASGEIPELRLADWFGYSSGEHAEDWLSRDGIHLTMPGAHAVGDYISRWVAHLAGAACPDDPDRVPLAVAPVTPVPVGRLRLPAGDGQARPLVHVR